MEMINFSDWSTSHQDVFAYEISGKNGFYLEIGGGDGIKGNNTYALERWHNWQGISIEKNKKRHFQSWQERNNKIVWDDALTINYKELLQEHNLPIEIDYLQVDIEPAENTYQALQQVINSGVLFKCCTFEHDYYISKEKYKQKADQLLQNNGYKVAVENVLSRKNKKYYETWYIQNNIVYNQKDWIKWQQEIKTWAGFF